MKSIKGKATSYLRFDVFVLKVLVSFSFFQKTCFSQSRYKDLIEFSHPFSSKKTRSDYFPNYFLPTKKVSGKLVILSTQVLLAHLQKIHI